MSLSDENQSNVIFIAISPDSEERFNQLYNDESTITGTTADYQLDGCSNISTLLRIVLPLSMPIIAVMVIFYGVGHWNSYFSALLYLKDRDKYPLSLVLREILLQGMGQEKSGAEVVDSVADLLLFETLKYAVIIVSSVPMLILYPALQRYFVKGTMVGSLKG